MPKAKFLSASEFNNLTRKQMIKELNRIAERVNRQISRLKRSNLDYTQVIQTKDLKRIRILKPTTKLGRKALIQHHNVLTREKPDYTQKAIKQAIKKKQELAKLLQKKNLTSKQYNEFERLVKRATSTAATFYQLLRVANDRQVIDDYVLPDETEGMDTDQAVDWLLEKINADMEAKNKQRRTPEDIEDAKMTIEEAERMAWQFESTTGQRRRRGTAWFVTDPEEIRQIEAMFPEYAKSNKLKKRG